MRKKAFLCTIIIFIIFCSIFFCFDNFKVKDNLTEQVNNTEKDKNEENNINAVVKTENSNSKSVKTKEFLPTISISKSSGYTPVTNVGIYPDQKPKGTTATGKVRKSNKTFKVKVGEKNDFIIGAPTNTIVGSSCGHTIAVYTPSDYCNISLIDNSNQNLVGNPTYEAADLDGERVFNTKFNALKPGTSSDVRVCYYANFGITFTSGVSSGYVSCPVCGRYALVNADTKWYRYNDVFGITVSADYQLKYDTNGGSEVAPTKDTKSNTNCDLKVTTEKPTKNGHVFLGWTNDPEGTTPNVSAEDIITLNWETDQKGEYPGSEANPISKTLYAVWETNYKVEWYDTDGNKIKDSEIRKGVVNDKVSIKDEDKVINGYTFDTTNKNNVLSMKLLDNEGVLKLYFTRDKANYIIEWYDSDGNKIKDSETRTGFINTTASVKYEDKEISGYTFDSTNTKNILQSLLVDGSTVLKLYFTRDKANYIVEWYDSDGNKIKDSETRTGFVNDIVAVTDEDKSIKGYTFDATNSNNILSLKLVDNEIILKLYFTKDKVSAEYKVEWYDIDGNAIKELEVRKANVGDVVTVQDSDKTISKYTFDSKNPKNILTAIMSEEGTVLRLYFNKNKANYKVEWYDEKDTLIKSEIRTTLVDEKISVTDEDKSIDGYIFDADSTKNILSAILEEKDTILKLYFKKIISYKIEWYDKNGNSIKNSEVRNGVLGSLVSVTEKDKVVEGYKFIKDNSKNILSGEVNSDKELILKLYFKKSDDKVLGVNTKDDSKTLLYIVISIVSLVIIVSLVFFLKKNKE